MMNHGRDDYDARIQDAGSLIPPDEPVFLLRGQDKAAWHAVMCWVMVQEQMGGDAQQIANARAHAYRMKAWAAEHGKTADVPAPVAPQCRADEDHTL